MPRPPKAMVISAHRESSTADVERLLASAEGALRVGAGIKQMEMTYTSNNLIKTLTLTFDRDGSDVTKTYTFSYTSNNLINSCTIT